MIKPNGQYILIIRGSKGSYLRDDTPHLKLVSGSVLYNCATKAGESDKSLQNGVYEYLKQYGQWASYESLHVEVHKIHSLAIFTADYPIENERVK